MSGSFGWRPAAREGIIPLRPLTFGEVLGKSFSALRHNPRVLLGFAIGVTVITSLISAAIIIWLSFGLLQRLSTFAATEYTSREFTEIMWGSLATIGVVSFVLSVFSMAVATIVQAVVAAEVGGAIVGERQTLGEIFGRVKSAIWRILGFSLLLGAVVVAFIALMGVFAVVLADAAGLIALPILAAVPIAIWIGVKLALTPTVIVLEREGVFASIRRSWALTGGFYWKVFGVIFLIGVIFGFAGQATGTVFGWLTQQFVPVLAPTGDRFVDLFTQTIMASIIPSAVTTVISAVGTIVSSTGLAIAYVDIRMRKEGLNIDLQNYLDDRDAGRSTAENPYAYDPSHVAAMPGYGHSGYDQYGYPQSYDQPTYGRPGYGQPVTGQPSTPTYTPPASGYVVPSTPPPATPGYSAPEAFFPVNDPEDPKNRGSR